MPSIVFIDVSGGRYVVDAPDGMSAMTAAVNNGVPTIDGDCGGSAACGTCHVFVGEKWRDEVGAPGDAELTLLSYSNNFSAGSRLACQIVSTPARDGLELHLPALQS